MQRKASIKILTLLILIVIACASILFSLSEINETAYAVLPESYITAVKDQNKDWQNGENYLNVSKIKNIVASLKSDYSDRLSDIEQSPIVVAVIDTGILATHDMFTGKYDENGKRKESVSVGEYDVLLRDEDGNIIGRNCVADNNDLSDIGYHGTHVAGIIAYYIHEFDLEKYIKIMPIKAATDEKTFYAEKFLYAVNYALGLDKDGNAVDGATKSDVINMSLTDLNTSASSFNLSKNITSQAIFVAAAGNSGEYSDEKVVYPAKKKVGYPAASEGVIGVMNYQQGKDGDVDLYQVSGRTASIVGTNFGDAYDFAAPGESILNADAEKASGDKYRAASGTSMSSPVVSFGAALRIFYDRLQNGGYDVAEVKDVLTNAEYKTVTKAKGFYYKPSKVGNIYTSTSQMSSSYTYKVFDFESILSNVEFAEILLDGDVEQTVDSVTAITFKFRAAGDRFTGGTVDWYVNNVLKRENSREFTFTPENAVGKVTVRAVWKSESDDTTQEFSKEINVNYIPLDETTVSRLEIKANKDGVAVTDYSRITLGSTLTFYVSSGKIEPAADDKILWYVDDKYVGVGKSYSYLATRSGDHTVKVKINNLEAPVATFSVISETQVKEKETRRILGIVSIAVGIGIGVSLIVLFAVVLDGKRKKKSKR